MGICCLPGSLPARFLRSQDELGAFLDSLLAQSKHPRLPVDRVGRGSFFTVGNDFMLKTLPPPGPCFSALLLGRGCAPTGAARTGAGISPPRQEALPDPFPHTEGEGVQSREGKRAELGCWHKLSVLCACVFLFGNNLQPVFLWNLNSVTNTNGSVLLGEGKVRSRPFYKALRLRALPSTWLPHCLLSPIRT